MRGKKKGKGGLMERGGKKREITWGREDRRRKGWVGNGEDFMEFGGGKRVLETNIFGM